MIKRLTWNNQTKTVTMQRVTGIGGIFYKAKDPQKMAAWYEKHLGIAFGGNTYMDFQWINHNDPNKPGNTVFSFFAENTQYFEPSSQPFMINFRVKNMDSLLIQLREESVEILGEPETYEYGKFAWVMDPEGNKIELWEPV
jgi:predicted enzyme related to lactoylglutathione lyase